MLMGIMNLTPDSFSGDGLLARGRGPSTYLRLARKLVRDGADIIDVGGESSRPGSRQITVREELRRVIPALRLMAAKIKVPLSIDTYRSEVAEAALGEGASMVNTIMGTRPDTRLLKAVRVHGAAIVLMHMRGRPHTMQNNPVYKDVVAEIIAGLRQGIEKCLEIGIKRNKIIIDPGIGFGKTVGQNFEILRRLREFYRLPYPLLIGTSRKSFIGRVLGQEAGNRIIGTAATVCVAVCNGAHLVRVHDVAAMRQAAAMSDAIIDKKT